MNRYRIVRRAAPAELRRTGMALAVMVVLIAALVAPVSAVLAQSSPPPPAVEEPKEEVVPAETTVPTETQTQTPAAATTTATPVPPTEAAIPPTSIPSTSIPPTSTVAPTRTAGPTSTTSPPVATTSPATPRSTPTATPRPTRTALSAPIVTQAIVPIDSGRLRLPATRAVWVEEALPNASHPDSTALGIGGSPTTRVFLAFDVAGLSGRSVRSATLRVWCLDGSADGPAVYPADAVWGAEPITWNHRPRLLGWAPDDRGVVVSGSWVEWNVTGLVTADGAVAFALQSSSPDTMTVAGMGGTTAPELVLTVAETSGPAPTAATAPTVVPTATRAATAPASPAATAISTSTVIPVSPSPAGSTPIPAGVATPPTSTPRPTSTRQPTSTVRPTSTLQPTSTRLATSTPRPSATPTVAPPVVEPNPFAGATLYVRPDSPARRQADAWRTSRPADAASMDIIARGATADWLGPWDADIRASVDDRVSRAAAGGHLPVLVAYNLGMNACANSGGQAPEAYKSWIRAFAAGIGSRRAVVVLEPDALAMIGCMSPADYDMRMFLFRDAVRVLDAQPGVTTYIDAGHANWVSTEDMVARLQAAGVSRAQGFSLNVSNFGWTADNAAYGRGISARLGGKHFVVDTSRNGVGPATDGQWCNPSGRAVGPAPTGRTGDAVIDAYLWVKPPGESDGTCNGGPDAGYWWGDYALGLARRSQG